MVSSCCSWSLWFARALRSHVECTLAPTLRTACTAILAPVLCVPWLFELVHTTFVALLIDRSTGVMRIFFVHARRAEFRTVLAIKNFLGYTTSTRVKFRSFYVNCEILKKINRADFLQSVHLGRGHRCWRLFSRGRTLIKNRWVAVLRNLT